MKKTKNKKVKPIFSGDDSRDFWKAINNIQYEEVKDVLYWFGCKLQELESKVEKLNENKK